jgi:hypothetical protein
MYLWNQFANIIKEVSIMPQNRPMPGEIYRHFKNKNYQIIAVATHSETREPYVVYQALYGEFMTYIRPYDMFISEVDHVKYPSVTQKYRFEYVTTTAKTEAQMQQTGTQTATPTSRKEPVEIPQAAAEQDTGVSPKLLEFLDAESYEDKLEILSSMEDVIDDHLINQMAASMDVIVEDGKLEERIGQLRRCIRTRAQYELRR